MISKVMNISRKPGTTTAKTKPISQASFAWNRLQAVLEMNIFFQTITADGSIYP
ncbi:hypothetical protein [Desulfopila sp. IMCC35006]|uniref:hypothetical protein n=1 Tax=Desulfopila sp. IMCC35006 TaxID=2569542 RepID=UPI0012946B23|nr:hypothetical protein [Desulfopila sp. IMCC35006]